MNPKLLSLLTDFGTRDSYVGQVKAVLLGLCPAARLVDLTHEISPGDVRAGALLLHDALPAFPDGSVHLAVVDPGVGGPRRGLALEAGGQRFVGPDNGLLWAAWRRAAAAGGDAAVELTSPAQRRDPACATFHARDVFAPAAAHLAGGGALAELGPPLANPVALELPVPRRDGSALVGEVLAVDRFGNCLTSVRAEDLAALGPFGLLSVTAGGRAFGPLRRIFVEVAPGERLAYVGSGGRLELALRDGDLAAAGLGRGAEVRVYIWSPG